MYTKKQNNNSTTYRRKMSGLATMAKSAVSNADIPDIKFYELEPAEVIDVILDKDHKLYNSPEDIGRVKVRMLYSMADVDSENLPWAKPISANVRKIPLKHEIVITAYYPARESEPRSTRKQAPKMLYYIQTLNALNSVNNNAMYGISLIKGEPDDEVLGNTITENKDIYPLQHKEGDVTIEGRFGNSIKFTSDDGIGEMPQILIRNGQRTDTNNEFLEPIEEDINEDASSIWMTSEKEVDLEIANDTQDSLDNIPQKYDGNQVVINSDRIMLNSKVNELMGFANKSINFSTKTELGLDANKKMTINTPKMYFGLDSKLLDVIAKKTIIDSDKIYLGRNSDEPVVLGNKLVSLLGELIDAIMKETHPTGTGPSGPPINSSQYASIKSKLKTILSKQNYSL